MTDLSRKRERDRLALDPNPYWHRLGPGQFLGWRSTSRRWVVRFGEASPGKATNGKARYIKGKQHYCVLEVHGDDYDGALKAAQMWLAQMGAAGSTTVKRGTVMEALNAYVADLREQGREDAADEAESRLKTTVGGDALAAVPLE